MPHNIRDAILGFILFSILFLGSIGVNGITLRNLCAIVLCYPIIKRFDRIEWDICQKSYFLYLIVLVICNLFSEQVTTFDFVQNFLAYHFVSIIIFSSFPIIIQSYQQLKSFFVFIAIIYVFNSVVSILQFYNVPIGWELGIFFSPGVKAFMEQARYYMDDAENFLSRSIVSGIMGFVVLNGCFSAVFLPIVTKDLLCKDCYRRKVLISVMLLLLAGITLFMIQQRMAFFIFLLYLSFVLFLRFKAYTFILLLVLILIACCIGIDFGQVEMGRLVTDGISSDSRMNQLDNLTSFFYSPDFLWGADLNNKLLSDSLGHNSILDSLRRGGFFSLLAFLFVFCVAFSKSCLIALRSFRQKYILTFSLSLSCVLCLLYSLTHSTGIQSGYIYFWVLYSLMLIAVKYEEDSVLYR